MNWTKRVPTSRATLRFTVLWTLFWVVWLTLAATNVYPTDGDFDRGWVMGWSAAFILEAIFMIFGVLGSLRQERNKQPTSQTE